MKHAVIETGSKQFIVKKGDVIDVELTGNDKSITFDALLVTDGKDTQVGTPTVKDAKVKAKIVDEIRQDKVTSIRFKAKKRVNTKRGHRQRQQRIEITSIS